MRSRRRQANAEKRVRQESRHMSKIKLYPGNGAKQSEGCPCHGLEEALLHLF